ncbi:MAG: glyceraldehyde 3-phosphate dehydrogenase NAD-binding domain-containing protein, partial [Thermoplasmata archaeon]
MIRIGINGFGRIGRNVYRAALESGRLGKDFEIVAVNDIVPVDSLAYLLKYDSVYGKLDTGCAADGTGVRVGPHRFEVTQCRDPAEIPWGKL